jgi:hypothetical protein
VPRTPRKNVGDDYHGCLSVRVRRSRELYLVVRGLVEGLAGSQRVDGTRQWQDALGELLRPDVEDVPSALV